MVSCDERVSLLKFLRRNRGLSLRDSANYMLQHIVKVRLSSTVYSLGEVIS